MGTARDMTILGVDAGGTFTDFVCIDAGAEASFRIYKTLSTPEAPERAILAGIRGLGLTGKLDSGDLHVIHGSTVATNAVLEGKVAKTVFITNHGFKDMLRLARQARPDPAIAKHAAAADYKPGHFRGRRPYTVPFVVAHLDPGEYKRTGINGETVALVVGAVATLGAGVKYRAPRNDQLRVTRRMGPNVVQVRGCSPASSDRHVRVVKHCEASLV